MITWVRKPYFHQVHHHFHIVHVVVDDLGWGDVGWRADSAGLADGVDTPVRT